MLLLLKEIIFTALNIGNVSTVSILNVPGTVLWMGKSSVLLKTIKPYSVSENNWLLHVLLQLTLSWFLSSNVRTQSDERRTECRVHWGLTTLPNSIPLLDLCVSQKNENPKVFCTACNFESSPHNFMNWSAILVLCMDGNVQVTTRSVLTFPVLTLGRRCCCLCESSLLVQCISNTQEMNVNASKLPHQTKVVCGSLFLQCQSHWLRLKTTLSSSHVSYLCVSVCAFFYFYNTPAYYNRY